MKLFTDKMTIAYYQHKYKPAGCRVSLVSASQCNAYTIPANYFTNCTNWCLCLSVVPPSINSTVQIANNVFKSV